MLNININFPILDLQQYLDGLGWLNSPKERVLRIEKPGEGNMNVVLRITTSERSFILKQSRPFVQKYPQIAAPLNRIQVEQEFYKNIKGDEINPHIPKILGYSTSENILMLEDLGQCEDMTSLYKKRKIEDSKLEELVTILAIIHKTKVPVDYPANLEMRQLNHQHIFVLPFLKDNGLQLNDVQKGLLELSVSYKKDMHIKRIVDQIGNKYLSKGETLLHGDYYPGSWMTKDNRLYVIDPEFSFVGFAEFDLGVMAAHLIMATMNQNYLDKVLKKYKGFSDTELTSQIAGIEIMRRLIGLAQLPMERSIKEKDYLLKMAHKMILS
ncbi:MAG: phosphotransferase [Maribacter sp.]